MTKRRTLAAYVLGAAFALGGVIPAFAGTSANIGPSNSLTKAATLGVLGRTLGEQELTIQGFEGLTGGPAQGALRKGDGHGLPFFGGASALDSVLPPLPFLSGGAPLRTQDEVLPENRLADSLPLADVPAHTRQAATPAAAMVNGVTKAAPSVTDAVTAAPKRYAGTMARVLVPVAVPARTAPGGSPAGSDDLPSLANADLSGVRLPNPTEVVRVG